MKENRALPQTPHYVMKENGALPQTPPRELFEKSSLGTLKNFWIIFLPKFLLQRLFRADFNDQLGPLPHKLSQM
jgi:hypothetical protein